MQLKKLFLVFTLLPATTFAVCPKPTPKTLTELAADGIRLDFAKDYTCGMDFVQNIQIEVDAISSLPKGKARTAKYREFFDASLAVAPYDQDSQNAESAADAIVADESLRPVLDQAIVGFQSKYDAGDLKQWCKAEVFRKVEASYECNAKKKTKCPEPTISYTECAHLTDTGGDK